MNDPLDFKNGHIVTFDDDAIGLFVIPRSADLTYTGVLVIEAAKIGSGLSHHAFILESRFFSIY